MTEPAESQPEDVRVADVLRVVRRGIGRPASLLINGESFPWATVAGFGTHSRLGEMPGVTLTIAAWRVEVQDDVSGREDAQ